MTAREVTLRDARPDDLCAIVAVDQMHSEAATPEYWKRILSQYGTDGAGADRVALVAEGADGSVQGFLFGEVRAWEFGSERCGWIFSVAVRPDASRRGLATQLCDEAVARFGVMGVGLVRTMVRRNDVPLLALFRSMGFTAGPYSEMERPVSGAEMPAAETADEEVA